MGDHEWELSKENVQPLRQGRHISSLVAALHPDESEEQVKAQQKHNFELELRTYSGDDPFSVWDSYIKWTEQYFPKGGHDGQLLKLLERCLREYQNDERYINDPRFIHLWIKFACLTDDPITLFSYMFDNGIGVTVASFYVEWAVSYERQGNNKKADAIYMEGLNRHAEPKDLLLQRHQQFQSRVARNITLQIAENQNPGMDMGEDSENRSALGILKASGTSHKVGTTRTGNVKLGSAGSLKDSRQSVPKQLSSRTIHVYNDGENVLPSLAPQQTNEWQSLPVRAVINQENDKKPGVWTDAKVKQRPGAVASVPLTIPFQIHEDPESATLETPRKTTLINTQPLSSRKASQTDVLSNLKRPSSNTYIMEIPMYQKHKLYNGLTEFSFEELRAAAWSIKKQKEKEAIAERLQKEEQRLKEARMHQQLLEVTASLAELKAQIQVLNFNRPADSMNQQVVGQQIELACQLQDSAALNPSESQPSVSLQGVSQQSRPYAVDTSNSNSASSSFVTPTNELASMTTSQVRPGDAQSTSLNRSLKTPIFNDAASYSGSSFPFNRSSSRPPRIGAPSNSSLCESSTASLESNSSMTTGGNSSAMKGHVSAANTSAVTPMETHPTVSTSSHSKSSHAPTPKSGKHTPDSKNRGSVKSLVAPSPTVYTQEALQCVMGMFSTSLTCDDHVMAEEEEALYGEVGAGSSHAPFEIHEDTTGTFKTERQNLKQDSVKKGLHNFYMDPDDAKENMVKSSVQKPPASTGHKGLEIYCDQPEDKENEVRATSVKRGARRGLGFVICEDVEMVDMDKEFQPMSSDFTIECQARNDLTLAALDSFMQAKFASTPYNRGLVDKTGTQAQELGDTVSACLTSSACTTNLHGDSVTHKQDLSPIFEGSGDGSSEDNKSSHQTHVASLQQTHVVPSQQTHVTADSVSTQSYREQRDNSLQDFEDNEAETERDVSMHEDRRLEQDTSCHHLIDTSAYIIPNINEKTEALTSTSVCLDPKDPFDDKTIEFFLKNLNPPISDYPNFVACSGQMPDINGNEYFVSLGKIYISVEKCIGEGGYAKIYRITDHSIGGDDTISLDSTVAPDKVIKVQSPACYWEFYVSCELRRRLEKLRARVNIVPSIMEIQQAYFFQTGSVLQMAYMPQGSLLNLVNSYKNDRTLLAGVEPFACLLTIELLHMFEQIHKCGFIHGDVKPDNFLLLGLPRLNERSRNPEEVFGSQLQLVQLIDFGQSIDLTKFAKGTTFRAKVVTSGFQCIEMRTDRPWTFQTDLFGLVGTVHVVLFGSYMNVFQERGEWRVTANFVRKWNVPLWKHLFNVLLNIPSCDQQPDLASLRAEFEKYFIDNLIPAYNTWVLEVKSLHTIQ